MICSDVELRQLCREGLVEPFHDALINPASINLRLGDQFFVYNTHGQVEYNLNEGERSLALWIEPGQFILAHTMETVRIPRGYCGQIFLRSTYARKGLNHALAGWIDPGFKGQITLELSSAVPVLVSAGEAICQLVVSKLAVPAEQPYQGRYQGSKGAVLPR